MGNTPDAISIITNQFGDSFINVVNESHFSNKSAASIYANISRTVLKKENTLYIIIGTDSGLFPKHIDSLPSPQGTKYLFIELELVYPISLELNADQQLNNVVVAQQSDWEEKASSLNLDHYIYDDKVTILNSLAAEQGHLPDYKELFSQVQSRLLSIRHELLSTTSQTDFLKNRLLNTVDNILPAKILEGKASGAAIILGAGPSLNKFIPWIKESQDKLTIIAVSRIYQQLTYTGITPDIVMSVDPFEINYHQSKAFLASKSVLFVHANHVNYRLPAQWEGLAFYRDTLFPWESSKNPENVSNEGPTVTHSALALAIEMGFDDIYLAGVDLCYEGNGVTHSDGQTLTNNTDNLTKPTVVTYNGKTTNTDYNLQTGVKDLADIALRRHGGIYNLNLNAAKVDGIKYIEKPEITQPKCQLPETLPLSEKQRHEHINIIKKELTRARSSYTKILKLCKDAIRFNNGLHGKKGIKQDYKNQDKLDKVEHKLATKYKSYTHLAQTMAARGFLRLLNQKSSNRTADEEYQWIKEYYNAYTKGSKIVLGAIEAAQKTVDSRLQEYKAKPNLKWLLEYWQIKDLMGRSCIWLNNHSTFEHSIHEVLQNQCDTFKQDITVNNNSKRLLNHAIELAKNNNWTQAINNIEQAYQLDNTLKDGFARLGWVLVPSTTWESVPSTRWEKAWNIAKRDLENHRLSAFWKIYVAMILGNLKRYDQAYALVSEAYVENPKLKDGYARVGWTLVKSENTDWKKAWDFVRTDLQNQTMSPIWQVHAAQLLGNLGYFDKACEMIEKAYASDHSLQDGFMRLGNIKKKLGDQQGALELIEKDARSGRLSEQSKKELIS